MGKKFFFFGMILFFIVLFTADHICASSAAPDITARGYSIFDGTMVDMTYPEVEKAAKEKAIVIFPTGVIEEIRLAWGSVGPTIVTSPEAEERLLGQDLTVGALRSAMPFAAEAARPIDDIRASAEYRRRVASNLLLRLAQYGPHP